MKPTPKRDPKDHFRAPMRHYHRANTEDPWDWQEWVDGRAKKRIWTLPRIKKTVSITAAILGAIAVIGLIIGLVIELR